jgi:hypothetical protein
VDRLDGYGAYGGIAVYVKHVLPYNTPDKRILQNSVQVFGIQILQITHALVPTDFFHSRINLENRYGTSHYKYTILIYVIKQEI